MSANNTYFRFRFKKVLNLHARQQRCDGAAISVNTCRKTLNHEVGHAEPHSDLLVQLQHHDTRHDEVQVHLEHLKRYVHHTVRLDKAVFRGPVLRHAGPSCSSGRRISCARAGDRRKQAIHAHRKLRLGRCFYFFWLVVTRCCKCLLNMPT